MLTNTEMQVAAAVSVGLKISGCLKSKTRLGGRREIRSAAMKPLSDDDSEPDDDAAVRAVHFSSFIIQ